MPTRPRTVASGALRLRQGVALSTGQVLAIDIQLELGAVSESIRSRLLGAGVRAPKIQLIPDGVEVPANLPGEELRAVSRAAWGFGANEFVTGHVGAFTAEKGQDIAVDAIKLLSDELRRYDFVLAGNFPARATVFTQRSSPSCSRAGTASGCWDISKTSRRSLPHSIFYIPPSRAEGLPALLRALIAMAQRSVGPPASAVYRRLSRPGRTGWLVEPRSPRALAELFDAPLRTPGVCGNSVIVPASVRRAFE
jgi:glycosyltransferase involved in cell wall biosynthesis